MRKMPDDVIISEDIAIPVGEIELTAIRSRGPGGQNVNKVSSAIQLRFDAAGCAALPEAVRERLLDMRDRRVTADGIVIIKSQEHRSQDRNRQAAIDRLVELLQSALLVPKTRRRTRPTRRSVEKRLSEKRHRADIKKDRGRIRDD
jgi:ribosome-associated protein